MDAGDLISLSCKILGGMPKPLLVWRRVDRSAIESKEITYDAEMDTLFMDFDRNDVNNYDTSFECVATNKFEVVISEELFAGPSKLSTHNQALKNRILIINSF